MVLDIWVESSKGELIFEHHIKGKSLSDVANILKKSDAYPDFMLRLNLDDGVNDVDIDTKIVNRLTRLVDYIYPDDWWGGDKKEEIKCHFNRDDLSTTRDEYNNPSVARIARAFKPHSLF